MANLAAAAAALSAGASVVATRLAMGETDAVTLAFTDVAIVFGPESINVVGSDYLLGDGLMLFGAFNAAIYSVFSRSLLGRYGSTFVTTLAILFGVLALFPAALVTGSVDQLPPFTREACLALLFLGTLGGTVQFLLFSWALRWLRPTQAVIYLTLSPISAMFLAVVMLGEQVTAVLTRGVPDKTNSPALSAKGRQIFY
ncbi:MAG: DMT family transporter [Gammaproteobacteria bacterium]|nr:DMT family transporter [Gammaproteobacteria bacterium]